MMWQLIQTLFIALIYAISDGQTNGVPDSGDPTNQGRIYLKVEISNY